MNPYYSKNQSVWAASVAILAAMNAMPLFAAEAEKDSAATNTTAANSAEANPPAPNPAATTTATPPPAFSGPLSPQIDTQGKTPTLKWKPGQTIDVSMDTEDIIATYDTDLAKRQAQAYPDNPEAAFIFAVALTRTSRVEEALKEVQRARRLAEAKGGAVYFDKMIAAYEKMLTAYPKENQVRYSLAWAYYMKAYLLARQSKKNRAYKEQAAQIQARALEQAKAQEQAKLAAEGKAPAQAGEPATATGGTPNPPAATTAMATTATAAQTAPASVNVGKLLSGAGSGSDLAGSLSKLATAFSTVNQPGAAQKIATIATPLSKADPVDVPQIKKYYELALRKVDELLVQEPNDIWATVYRAHLKAEYTGNLQEAMTTWNGVKAKHPNNPASYFFLGEGYLKQGNLKESINHVSRAVALRALGN